VDHSALFVAILERQNLLQERWDDLFKKEGLGALAFLPECYEGVSSPNAVTWEYWTTSQINLYLKSEGGPSPAGRRWLNNLPRTVHKGFAAIIISNGGDPSTEDAYFYRFGERCSDDTQ
jgi:hypothetical protein